MPTRRALFIVPVCAVLAGAAWFGLQSQASGTPDESVPQAKAPAAGPVAAPQLSTAPELVERARTAAPGRVLARGERLTVDELPATGAIHSRRLSISGSFPLRAVDPTVTLNGMSLGRAVPAPDLHSILVVLPARTVVPDGAVVSYRYGSEPAVRVGALHKVVR
ncbi:MAG TPA: hypothetical protein VHC49_02115 [Mycobacteriales bacterium]|nr:hypothetical protein [Mycobacteriales bacterium]